MALGAAAEGSTAHSDPHSLADAAWLPSVLCLDWGQSSLESRFGIIYLVLSLEHRKGFADSSLLFIGLSLSLLGMGQPWWGCQAQFFQELFHCSFLCLDFQIHPRDVPALLCCMGKGSFPQRLFCIAHILSPSPLWREGRASWLLIAFIWSWLLTFLGKLWHGWRLSLPLETQHDWQGDLWSMCHLQRGFSDSYLGCRKTAGDIWQVYPFILVAVNAAVLPLVPFVCMPAAAVLIKCRGWIHLLVTSASYRSRSH